MTIDDGQGAKTHAAWLERPDIKDMLSVAYPAGRHAPPPGRDVDPGRARNAALFDKMYGNCGKGGVSGNLVDVAWLPRKGRQVLKVTRVNGVAERLAAVSRALDALPARFDGYLMPAAGTYNCRPIAGTDRGSAHGWGIAIDIALPKADYWRWTKPGAGRRARLAQSHSHGDRGDLRGARLHLGRALVALRHHALRVPAGAAAAADRRSMRRRETSPEALRRREIIHRYDSSDDHLLIESLFHRPKTCLRHGSNS